MANFLLRIINEGFAPDTDQDWERFKRFKYGDGVTGDIKKPRNYEFHKKYFALLNVGFENQDKYDDFKHFRLEVQLKAGHFEAHVTTKGKVIYVPKSISFSNIDDIEFGEIYQKAIDVILKYFCVGSTQEEIDEQVLRILNFT